MSLQKACHKHWNSMSSKAKVVLQKISQIGSKASALLKCQYPSNVQEKLGRTCCGKECRKFV